MPWCDHEDILWHFTSSESVRAKIQDNIDHANTERSEDLHMQAKVWSTANNNKPCWSPSYWHTVHIFYWRYEEQPPHSDAIQLHMLSVFDICADRCKSSLYLRTCLMCVCVCVRGWLSKSCAGARRKQQVLNILNWCSLMPKLQCPGMNPAKAFGHECTQTWGYFVLSAALAATCSCIAANSSSDVCFLLFPEYSFLSCSRLRCQASQDRSCRSNPRRMHGHPDRSVIFLVEGINCFPVVAWRVFKHISAKHLAHDHHVIPSSLTKGQDCNMGGKWVEGSWVMVRRENLWLGSFKSSSDWRRPTKNTTERWTLYIYICIISPTT